MSNERLLITGAAQSGRLHRKSIFSKLQSSSQLTYESPLSEIYRQAVLLEIDFTEKKILRRLEVSSEEMGFNVEGYATNFTVPSRIQDRLFVPSHGEIFEIDLEGFQIISRRSMRLLNDTHHVALKGDKIYVASTGLDRVLILDGDDCEVLPTIPDALPLEPHVDYRLVNTKPHASHPNHIAFVGDELWITRANQHDWTPLSDFDRAIPLSDVVVHDGFNYQGKYYFTAVKGQIIIIDPQLGEIVSRVNLHGYKKEGLTGFCRGLLVNEEFYFVGYSIIRLTRFMENLKWIKAELLKTEHILPTRVEKIDRKSGKIVDKFTFGPEEIAAIYWIGPA